MNLFYHGVLHELFFTPKKPAYSNKKSKFPLDDSIFNYTLYVHDLPRHQRYHLKQLIHTVATLIVQKNTQKNVVPNI